MLAHRRAQSGRDPVHVHLVRGPAVNPTRDRLHEPLHHDAPEACLHERAQHGFVGRRVTAHAEVEGSLPQFVGPERSGDGRVVQAPRYAEYAIGHGPAVRRLRPPDVRLALRLRNLQPEFPAEVGHHVGPDCEGLSSPIDDATGERLGHHEAAKLVGRFEQVHHLALAQ